MTTMCNDKKYTDNGLWFTCTLDAGHSGPHVAEGAMSRPLRIWVEGGPLLKVVEA